MKDKSNKNNVVLFNRLTHYNGLVDNDLFKKLLNEFDNYAAFKKLVSDTMTIKGIETQEGKIKFPIKFKSKKGMKSFIEDNKNKEITLSDVTYTTKIKTTDKCTLTVHFE